MIDLVAEVALAVAFFRSPTPFSETSFLSPPLTQRTAVLFPLATGRQPMLDHYAAQCAVSAQELQAAARFFVERLIVLPQATHYQLLGVDRDASTKSIKTNHQCLMQLFHPDKAPYEDSWSLDFVEKINNAYGVLRNPAARRRYDEFLHNTYHDRYVLRFRQRSFENTRESLPQPGPIGQSNASRIRKLLPYIIWFGAGATAIVLIGASLVSNPP